MPMGSSNAFGPAGLTLKAWVQFVGSTGAIIKSANVASVVRSATGAYTITFTNAMATTTYVVRMEGEHDVANKGISLVLTVAAGKLVGSCQIETHKVDGGSAAATRDMSGPVVEFWE